MTQVLHDIEKKIIAALRASGSQTIDELCRSAGLRADQVRRGAEWLRHKGLAKTSTGVSTEIRAVDPSTSARLPETRMIDELRARRGEAAIADLQSLLGGDFGAALGIARTRGWVEVRGGSVRLAGDPHEPREEELLRSIRLSGGMLEDMIADKESLSSLRRRPGILSETTRRKQRVSLTAAAGSLDASRTGIDVEAEAPPAWPARAHPLREVIAEVRDAFVALGFAEVSGPMVQPCFWNFDALFTPQDHPAREMQDTFYLERAAAPLRAARPQLAAVAAEHRRHWRGWSPAAARRAVLRTHTTCVTIRHIAETAPTEARVFSLGRVFRNEKASYKHLAEFHQVEGAVVGRSVSLRGLMGIQKEFYRRMGMRRVRFWPTFFPYTEPSLQSMVYSEELGKWIELFGMGIFRQEVTRPLGIRGRVLAWGGGIERIAMMRHGLRDVRELYANDLRWLRGAS